MEVLYCLGNPNIIEIFGLVIEENYVGIIMEYLHKSLYRSLFIREDKFTGVIKKKIISQAANGLVYLHDRGITHGNLKVKIFY